MSKKFETSAKRVSGNRGDSGDTTNRINSFFSQKQKIIQPRVQQTPTPMIVSSQQTVHNFMPSPENEKRSRTCTTPLNPQFNVIQDQILPSGEKDIDNLETKKKSLYLNFINDLIVNQI